MAGVRNLTQVEAAERARLLDVAGYDITLDLTDGHGTFRSTTVVTFRCAEPGAETFIEAAAVSVRLTWTRGSTSMTSAGAVRRAAHDPRYLVASGNRALPLLER